MAEAARIDIPQPPRQSGDPASDAAGLIEWVWQFYNAVVTGSGFLQPADLGTQLEDQFPILHAFGTLEGTEADKLAYFSGAETFQLTDLTSFSRTVLGSSTAAEWRSEIGVVTFTDEQVQDSVGGILTDTATIDFTYNDGAPSITADVKTSSITFSLIQDIATNTLIGRSTAGSGSPESIACTAAGRALIGGDVPILPTYTVAGLPAAASHTRGMVYVSNEVGGAIPAFSDGVNWRRVTDRAIVS